ncbi:MAG: hypothetical protein EPO16_02810 [Dehalococcoidia bacterium]|nr:MAG: hypothetical protein EPO16_02810 [Dehalococcoidia bacterium]
MTRRLPVDEIVDRCVEEIRSGRSTVEECLRRYPELNHELEPLLRAAEALSALPRTVQAFSPDPHQRAAFMATLRETPQQRRRWQPSLPALLGTGAFRIIGPAVALAALAVVAVFGGGGGTPAAASTLTVFDGEVQRLDSAEWRPMRDGDTVEPGVRLRTGAAGHALLTFPDGSTVALDPLTELAVETIAVAPRRVEVRQLSGRLWHDVVHDETAGARFVVLTPDARVEVAGTVFETIVDVSTGQTDVATVDGEVRVVAGSQTVPVGRGETLRASAATIQSVSTAPLLDGALTVNGPFAAAIMATDGRGAGVRTDGVVFQQLRGVTTSRQDGHQRFDLQDAGSGDLVLVLQRYGEGGGEIVLDTAHGQQRFKINAETRLTRLPLRLEVFEGLPAFAVTAPPVADDAAPVPAARIVTSDRTKDAVELGQGKEGRGSGRATTARTPTPNNATSAPASPATDRDSDRTATRTPDVTPTPSPTPSVAATNAVPDAAVLAYAQRLRIAIASGRPEAIRAALLEAVAGDNSALRRRQVAVIASALGDDTNALRIGSLFVSGDNGALRDSLRTVLAELGNDARETFDDAVAHASERRQQQSSDDNRTPTATPRAATPATTTTATATLGVIITPSASGSLVPLP